MAHRVTQRELSRPRRTVQGCNRLIVITKAHLLRHRARSQMRSRPARHTSPLHDSPSHRHQRAELPPNTTVGRPSDTAHSAPLSTGIPVRVFTLPLRHEYQVEGKREELGRSWRTGNDIPKRSFRQYWRSSLPKVGQAKIRPSITKSCALVAITTDGSI